MASGQNALAPLIWLKISLFHLLVAIMKGNISLRLEKNVLIVKKQSRREIDQGPSTIKLFKAVINSVI
jgi:hypothetical protein